MAVPSQIELMLAICKSDLNHHLDLLSDAAAPHGRFALGIAQGLSALVQICPFRPLFFSTNVIVDIWALANSLLQMSSKSDLRSSQVQIQVSWNLIGGLMAAGPQFVKSRINQLLLLWQNALPRPLPKDSMAGRNTAELQYLLHVREKALAALCLFLRYNVKLLTLDTSKRIAIMLADTNTFVGRLPSGPPPDDARMLASHSQLLDIAIKVKMRVLRCYYVFVNQDIKTIAGPELLMTAISIFVDSDPLISKSISGKSPTVGTFDSFASSTDNHGWGVSSYIRWMSTSEWNDGQTSRLHWSVWDSDSDMLEQMVSLHAGTLAD
jgi:HEAT repeat-containing protein 5